MIDFFIPKVLTRRRGRGALPGSRRAQQRLARRRGSVIVMAVGVLAILAIVSLAYVTVVRVDRSSVTAVARGVNYGQQAGVIADEIGGLLAADLFGGKQVDNSAPQNAWPSMFIDGEFSDYPSVETTIQGGSVMPVDGVPLREDPWLAPSEPNWITNQWTQISNLRSAWKYDDRNSPTFSDDRYLKGDGEYLDLAQFFIQQIDGRGNPDADLTDFDWGGIPNGPQLGVGAGLAVTGPNGNGVYNYQVHELSQAVGDAETALGAQPRLTQIDSRYFADTDGDLRADARWQTLDSLGDLYGLKWICAARIVDASALLNVNSNLEFGGGPTNLDRTGDGRTPADVDLFRIISRPRYSLYQPTGQVVSVYRTTAGFRFHLEQALGVDRFWQECQDQNVAFPSGVDPDTLQYPAHPDYWQVSDVFGSYRGTYPAMRSSWWHFFGSAPQTPTNQFDSPRAYSPADMVDFFATWGTNPSYNTISRIEKVIDGPDRTGVNDPIIGGYLPKGIDIVNRRPEPTSPSGPLLSNRKASQSRILSFPPVAGRPTPWEIRWSPRRMLTAVSGVGNFSPVPVLNFADPQYQSLTRRTKVQLSSLTNDEVPLAFEAFVWALAPLATNVPLTRELIDAGIFGGAPAMSTNNMDYHYGGGPNGPARWIDPDVAASGVDPAAGFAIRTAMALAVNAKDARDADSVPTWIRFFPQPQSDLTSTPEIIEVGSSFAHGEVPQTLMPAELLGNAGEGVSAFGFERQPYLREVVFTQAYSAADETSPFGVGTSGSNTIDCDSDDQLGCAFAFELANPWNTDLSVENYAVVLPESADTIGTTNIVFNLPNTVIPAGQTAVFWYSDDPDPSVTTVWDVIAGEINTQFTNLPSAVKVQLQATDVVVPTGTLPIIFFRALPALPAGAEPRPVLLVQEVPDTSVGGNRLVIVDRMTPDREAGSMPPIPDTIDLASGGVAWSGPGTSNPDGFDNIGSAGLQGNTGYFTAFNYLATDPRIGNGRFTGRVLLTTSFSRPGAQPAQGGFPAYTIEFPLDGAGRNRNIAKHTRVVRAWLTPVTNGDLNGIPPNPPVVPPLALDLINGTGADTPSLYTFADNHHQLGEPLKFADTDPLNASLDTEMPAFALYAPDRALPSVADILQLSCYAHLCVGADLANLDQWTTVGEQLGRSTRYRFNDPFSGPLNPYIGKLDPSRFILTGVGASPAGDMGQVQGLPSVLNLPLALRTIDPFEALSPRDSLAQGRINLNTAIEEVLQALPFFAPKFNVTSIDGGQGTLPGVESDRKDVGPPAEGDGSPPTFINTALTQNWRSALLMKYRDRFFGSSTNIQRSTFLGDAGAPVYGMRADGRPGLTTAAEIAVLGPWSIDGALSAALAEDAFTDLGIDGVGADGQPLEMSIEKDTADNLYFPIHGPGVHGTNPPTGTNPIDDPEERTAIFRAVSNIVSSRSDVYIAWFVVRAYDPATIARIRVDGTPLEAMEDENFRPVYESRWLAVFDRSNIVRPIDRPRLLLLTEIGSAQP